MWFMDFNISANDTDFYFKNICLVYKFVLFVQMRVSMLLPRVTYVSTYG